MPLLSLFRLAQLFGGIERPSDSSAGSPHSDNGSPKRESTDRAMGYKARPANTPESGTFRPSTSRDRIARERRLVIAAMQNQEAIITVESMDVPAVLFLVSHAKYFRDSLDRMEIIRKWTLCKRIQDVGDLMLALYSFGLTRGYGSGRTRRRRTWIRSVVSGAVLSSVYRRQERSLRHLYRCGLKLC
jgi:hypothetical protein